MEVIISLRTVSVVQSTNFMQLSIIEYLSKFIVIYLDQERIITNLVIITIEERFQVYKNKSYIYIKKEQYTSEI